MASDSKKARKKAAGAGKAGAKRKFKIPKEIGGVKIPKELRKESEKLIEAVKGLVTAQATAAAFNALSRIKVDIDGRGRGRPH